MANITTLFNSLLNKKQGNNHEAATSSISDGDTNTIGFQQKPRPVLKPAPVRKPVVLPSPSPASMITLPPSRDPVTPDDSTISRLRATASSFDPQAIVGDLDTQPALPALPQFKPHEKHGVGERIVSFFRGGREGGLGGAIQGARDPGQMEHQDWQHNTLAPAFAERQLLSKEADAQAERKIKRGQLLSQLINAKANQTKAETDAAAPHDKSEFLMHRDPTTGQWSPVLGPDSKPIRHSTVAVEDKRGQNTLNVETKRGENSMNVEKERTGRAKYTTNVNANSRIGAAKIGANARLGAAQIGANSGTGKSLEDAQKQEAEKQAWLDALQNAIQSSNGVKDSEAIQNAVEHLRKYPDIEVGEGGGGWPYAKRIAKAPTTKAPTSGKVFPAHQLESYAKAHGATVEEAKRYLEAQGYAIR